MLFKDQTAPSKINKINVMKNFTFTIIMFLCLSALMAQVPAGFSYQSVVRNTEGEIIANQDVTFKFSILRESESGEAVYVETHSAVTNDFGLVNLTKCLEI